MADTVDAAYEELTIAAYRVKREDLLISFDRMPVIDVIAPPSGGIEDRVLLQLGRAPERLVSLKVPPARLVKVARPLAPFTLPTRQEALSRVAERLTQLRGEVGIIEAGGSGDLAAIVDTMEQLVTALMLPEADKRVRVADASRT